MLAGDPALDFANTLHWRGGRQVDFIPDYESLVGWSVPAGLLQEPERDVLMATAAVDPGSAAVAHELSLNLRDRWREHLSAATIGDRQGSQRAFAAPLSGMLSDLMAESQLLLGAGGSTAVGGGRMLLLPVVRAALSIVSLHVIPASRQIGRCEGDPCGGFFLNTSRSKPRRWCSMDTCGNRAKVRQFRSRSAAEDKG